MKSSFTVHHIRHALLCSAIATGVVVPTAALAQDRAAPAITGEQPKAQGGLEDIVVTARKKVENLQNIPVAATVVSPVVMQNFQINNIEKMANLAPQLIVGRSGTGNGAAISLRGISVNATSISLEQSVATVIDGVYYSGGRALNEGLFDLERAEVLKGPQSLFNGKNTTAGALSFTTADPQFKFHAMARASYEFKAEQPTLEGYVTGPLTDTLAVRLAARVTKQYGALIDNEATGGTTYSRDIVTGIVTAHPYTAAPSALPGERSAVVRGGIKFQPTSNFTATLKSTYNRVALNSASSNTLIGFCEQGFVQSDHNAPCGTDWKAVQQNIAPDIAATDPLLNKHGGKPYLDYRSFNVTGNLVYHGDKFTATVTPAYTDWVTEWRSDGDFVNAYSPVSASGASGGNGSGERSQLKAFSTEARVQTDLGGPINFMAGGYFQRSRLYFQQDNLYPGGVENSAVTDQSLRYLTLRKVSHTYGKTYSGFGQVLWDILPKLNFTAGARYTHETKDSVFAQPYVVPTAQGTYRQGSIGADQVFNNFSPEATLTWKPMHNVTVYGSYKTGYKSGGFSISGLITNKTTAADATFAPEKVKGFEGGIKSTLMDNQLRANLDLFRYDYSNLQVDFFDATIVQYLTLNAGKARTQGGELQLEYAPRDVPGLTVKTSAAFTDAKYTSFHYAPCLAGQRPSEGCNLGQTPNGVRTFQDMTGQRTQQAPKWTGNLAVDYSKPIGGGLKAGISTNVRYSSSYHTSPFANELATRFVQPQYATLDANIRLAAVDDKWELALIGKNLTNHFVVAAAFDLTYTGSGTGTAAGVHADGRSSVYDPRTVAIQGTVKF